MYFQNLILVLFLLLCNVLTKNDTNDMCDAGLLSQYLHFPVSQEGLEKGRRILQHIRDNDNIAYVSLVNLPSAANRTATMLQRYGIHVEFFELFDELFYQNYRPGRDCVVEIVHSTIPRTKHMVDFKSGTLNVHRQSLKFDDHYRIFIQSEQLQGRFFREKTGIFTSLRNCHKSSKCLILEYSDFNYKLLKKKNIHKSALLAPVMYVNISRSGYISPQSRTINDTINSARYIFRERPIILQGMKPLHKRKYHFSSFVSMFERRKNFTKQFNSFSKKYNLQTMIYVGTSRQKKVYDDSKVCMIPSSEDPPFPGEYHRTFELLQHGCMILYETSNDTLGREMLEQCGGIQYNTLYNILKHGRNIALDIGNYTSYNTIQYNTLHYNTNPNQFLLIFILLIRKQWKYI
jgi:hypothetical protein